MNTPILTDGRASFMRTIVLLAATLAALMVLVSLGYARSSEAADAPLLTVNPTDVGFGAVEVNTTGDPLQTVTIRNTSGGQLTLGGITLGGTDLGQFSLINPLPVGGITLDRDGTYQLQVAFNPTSNGTKTAELGFNIVGGGANSPTVTLSGTGTNEPPTNQTGAQGCDIVGTGRGETLTGTPQHDVICGLGGGDKINGLGANDILKGGRGNDRIIDHNGKDKLLGQGGRDTLNARDHAGGDVLKGGARKDRAVRDKRDRARGI